MQIPLSDGGLILVPLTYPTDIPDITVYPVRVAMLPDGPGEPTTDDYVLASWVDGQVATSLADQGIVTGGKYKLWTKISTDQEPNKVIPGPVIGVGY